MHLLLTTHVAAPVPARVLDQFDEALFRALAPPFPRLRVKRFDGSQPGDVVAVEMDWGLWRQPWVSHIVEEVRQPDGVVWFTDEGRQMPWPFRTWRHRHLFQPAPGGGTLITEDLTYGTGFGLLDWLMRPALWALLAWRKPIYRRRFGAPQVGPKR